MNIPGYGATRKWVPPLSNPESLLTIYDRFVLTESMRYLPFITGFAAWCENFGSGDTWDGFWYNNAAAAGSQLYPKGLEKYFDLHSIEGLFGYFFHWVWDTIQSLMLPITFFIPVDVWLAFFNGASMEGMWKIFVFYLPFSLFWGWFSAVPSAIAGYFQVEMEDGWGMMFN